MNSEMNKTQLAEKRYRDKVKKDKKEIRLNTKRHKKQNKKVRKLKKVEKSTIINYKKQKSQQNYKRKNNVS